MTQGSGRMAGAPGNDDRAIVGLFRAIEGSMPGCPVDMAIKARDGAEKRYRGILQSVTLQGLVFRAAAPHHLPEIWDGDTITIWVGTSMYRLHGRIRPALGTDIAIDWPSENQDGHMREQMHPIGHAPVKPAPLTLPAALRECRAGDPTS